MNECRLCRVTLATEPLIEVCRADARIVAGGEGVIVQLYAEVAGVDVCDYLACVVVCDQESLDELVETELFGTSHLDRAVQGCPDCEISQYGSHIIRRDRLHKGR